MPEQLGLVLDRFLRSDLPLDLFELQVVTPDEHPNHWYEWLDLPEVVPMNALVEVGTPTYNAERERTEWMFSGSPDSYFVFVLGNHTGQPVPPKPEPAYVYTPSSDGRFVECAYDGHVWELDFYDMETVCDCGALLEYDCIRCGTCHLVNPLAYYEG